MNQTSSDSQPIVDLDGDGLPDIQSETDLDAYLARIEGDQNYLLTTPGQRFNVKAWEALADRIAFAAQWFDEDGNRLPVQPDPQPDTINLSPPAVHLEEGQDPSFYDALDGLHVSHQRSNGCVILANPYLTGVYWRDNFEEVAADEKCSPRIVAIAGHWLVQTSRWNCVPIAPAIHATRGLVSVTRFWISDGGTPFNAEEIRMALFNHSHASGHGSIFAGASLAKAPFYLHPSQQPGQPHTDLLPGHSTYSAGQQPQMIVPLLIAKYNTPAFMREAYSKALGKAHAIDDGRAAPVPGYITPEEAGGENSEAWRNEFEDSDVLRQPTFSRRGLLV